MSTSAAESESVSGARNRQADPCILTIFGATGDLTKRKLLPALYNLAAAQLLSPKTLLVGVATREHTSESFREQLRSDMHSFAPGELNAGLLDALISRLHYIRGDVADPALAEHLREELKRLGQENDTPANYFYYLALAPRFFGPVIDNLGNAGLLKEENGTWRRVVIEKPFGRDLESARELNAQIRRHLTERQIYRIDHYLGKETVQNILVFRFSNGVFEPIWNRRYVDHIQITAAETVGVEARGGYYESAGALRDMLPNHLFQLLSLTAMEPPTSFAADAVRDEQEKVLQAMQPLKPEDVLTRCVRGQYGEGSVDGENVRAYRAEEGVAANSTTETFVGLKLLVDNWRWADVPFYLRTGKRLPKRVTEIAIQFRRAPFQMFRETAVESLRTNRLVIQIAPQEGIKLRFGAKIPGAVMEIGGVQMQFNYHDYFGTTPSTGYERLLYDCMLGDQTLFQRADMVESAWSVIAPILDVWSALPPREFPNYAAGTWGPRRALELLTRDGREWREIDDHEPVNRAGSGSHAEQKNG